MCSRGKDWWVHSPKIPVQSFKWASQTFYLNLQRFKMSNEWFWKKVFFLRICDETEECFSGYKQAIIQLKYKTTQHWPNMTFFQRGRGGWGLIVSVCRVCCSSVFHVRPSSLCPPDHPPQSLIKFPRTHGPSFPLLHLDSLHQKPPSWLDPGLMWAGLVDHLEPWLVDDVQQVLGVNCEGVSCH